MLDLVRGEYRQSQRSEGELRDKVGEARMEGRQRCMVEVKKGMA